MSSSISGNGGAQVNRDSAPDLSNETEEAQALKLVNDLFKEYFPPDGDTAAPGAPRTTDPTVPTIGDVLMAFDPEGMALIIRSLQQKTEQGQLSSAEKGLQISQTKINELHEKSMAKIKEWIQNCADAEAKKKASGPLDWLAKIGAFFGALVALVVAVVATLATGLAAAPLLILAVMAVVGTGLSLASAISQSKGGPALDVNSLMTKGATAMLTAFGVPADKVEAAAKVLTGALAVLVPAMLFADPSLLGNLAGGFLSLVGVDETNAGIVAAAFTVMATLMTMAATIVLTGGAAGLTGNAKIIEFCGRIATAAGSITAGSCTVGSGALKIQQAEYAYKAEMAQTERKQFDAFILRFAKMMEDNRDEVEKIMEKIEDGTRIVMDVFSSSHASNEQVIRNTAAAAA